VERSDRVERCSIGALGSAVIGVHAPPRLNAAKLGYWPATLDYEIFRFDRLSHCVSGRCERCQTLGFLHGGQR
jgi:hypothetical protein